MRLCRPDPTRRDLLRALAASALGANGLGGCAPTRSGAAGEASLWFAYGGKNREVLLSLVDAFNASQGRYRIYAVYQGDYFESLAKLRTAMAVRAAPALTHVLVEVIPYLVEAGVLEPLEPFVGEIEPSLVPALTQRGGYTGGSTSHLFALPFNRSTPIAYCNKPLFRELGLTPPSTWDELRAVARAATVRDARGTTQRWGFECPVDWWFWVALVGQAGGVVIDEGHVPTLGGESGVRALSFWQTLVHDDRSMKPPPGRDYNAWQAAHGDFVQGRAAMIWSSTAFLRYLEDNAKFEVGAAKLPKDTRFAVPTGGTLFVMPKGAPPKEQEAAAAFLRWMLEPAQANAWATRTGYIPVSRAGIAELEQQGYFQKHPNDRIAIDQLAHVITWPWSTELFRIEREVVQPRLEEAVLAPRDAREVLAEARKVALSP